MASNATASDNSCIVCLGSEDLKAVGGCIHGVCTKCLQQHVAKSKKKKFQRVFNCPICLARCVLPVGGIDALQKYVPQPDPSDKEPIPTPTPEKTERHDVVNLQQDMKCKFCLFIGREEQAVSKCQTCDNMLLCRQCTDAHANTKATEKHTVLDLSTERLAEDICQQHGQPLKTFCHTCNRAVCSFCLMTTHGSHSVASLPELIASKKAELKPLVTEQQKRLDAVEQMRKILLELTDTALMAEKQEDLLEAIEQQSKKIMESVPKWKKEKKEEVRKNFRVISRIARILSDCAKTMEDLRGPIMKASEGLAESGERDCDYHKVMTLISDLQSKQTTEPVDILPHSEISKELNELCLADYTFLPAEITSFGDIVSNRLNRLPEDFNLEEVSKHTLQVGPEYHNGISYINDHYAVSKYNGNGTSSIYLHDLPSHTLRHKIDLPGSCFGLCETPDNHLAAIVAHHSGRGNDHMMNIYNTRTGEVKSSVVLHLGDRVCARDIAVTPEYKLVILCRNVRNWKEHILVTNKEGAEQSVYRINGEYDIPDYWGCGQRMSCSGKYIFIRGKKSVGIFEMRSDGIQAIKTLRFEFDIESITSTASGDLFVTKRDKYQLYLERLQKRGDEWKSQCIQLDSTRIPLLHLLRKMAARSSLVIIALSDSIMHEQC